MQLIHEGREIKNRCLLFIGLPQGNQKREARFVLLQHIFGQMGIVLFNTPNQAIMEVIFLLRLKIFLC